MDIDFTMQRTFPLGIVHECSKNITYTMITDRILLQHPFGVFLSGTALIHGAWGMA